MLSSVNPVYGCQRQKLKLKKLKSLRKGGACQKYSIEIENHWGTHVDCPAHFFIKGNRISNYPADFWIFYRPQIIPVEVQPGQIICQKDLTVEIAPEIDLLLLKSGWSKLRGTKKYSNDNPGLDPEFGLWLRRRYPSIRAIGFDWVSLSSYKHRELGRKAHKIFLDPKAQGHPILIIEDMFFPKDIKKVKEVWIVPLRIEGLDSAPCTVMGVFR